jgi:predicted GH43/DUF377 family glycosyl hydrolase
MRSFKRSIKKAQHKTTLLLQQQDNLLHFLNLSIKKLSPDPTLPTPLTHIPLADRMGVVLSIKQITIPSIDAPYNASIGLSKNGYILFFRHDTPSEKKAALCSHIGCIYLSSDFEPVKNTLIKIDTKSTCSEDARFFEHMNRQFLVFSDLISQTGHRSICISPLCSDTKKLEYITPLQSGAMKIEKNWTPFSHENQIFFIYSLSPQKILELPNSQKSHLNVIAEFPTTPIWPAKWGIPRGGTPAILVDGEYLCMFHSSFRDDKGIIWYVMGACTFASTFPFKITRISSYPILFQNIYQIVHSSQANPKIRSIYPAGLIYEKRGDKDVISVSCGENDSCIKIITLDKAALFASLRNVL